MRFFIIILLFLMNCSIYTLTMDKIEIEAVKKYIVPKGSIILKVDTVNINNEKLIRLKYFGRKSGRPE